MFRKLIGASVGLTMLVMAASQSHAVAILNQTFNNPAPTIAVQFGSSVAIDGNNVVVGAHRGVASANESGQAYLFDNATGTLLQTFNDPTPTAGDGFGFSVAIDGNFVLIGDQFDDTSGDDIDNDVGQAYLLDATTGTLLQTFNDPTPTDRDRFGFAVAIDGNNVLISAPFDDTSGDDVGQAHLFDAATGTLLQTFNDPTPTTEDAFGFSVAIDGNFVLIGAPFDDTSGNNLGQAYLFDATTGTLLQTFNDPTPTIADEFGFSVAIDGNFVLIGAPFDITSGDTIGQAFLFDAAIGTLLQTFNDPTPTGGDLFGFSVAIDGNNVLISAVSDDTSGVDIGQAHLFDALTGNLLETLNDPMPTNTHSFGQFVAIDGNNVVVGAPSGPNASGIGQAHSFTVPVTVPEPPTILLLLTGLAGLGMMMCRRV